MTMADSTQQLSRQDELSHIDLLLMGKSGHGKSSTGNSILGCKFFKAQGGGRSVTKLFKTGYADFEGRRIKVVDIPGLYDTESTPEQQKTLVEKAISEGLSRFLNGFSALLLVMSYEARITDEEIKTIETLKTILGDDILSKHTVCVFTHGDSFKDEQGDEMDLDEWIDGQDDRLKKVINECDRRIVIFDNKTKVESEQKEQVRKLISMIERLKERQTRYTSDNLLTASNTRGTLKEEARQQKVNDEYSEIIGLVKFEILTLSLRSPAERKQRLEQIKQGIIKGTKELSKDSNKHLSGIKDELLSLGAIIRLEELDLNLEENNALGKIQKIEHTLDAKREENGFVKFMRTAVIGAATVVVGAGAGVVAVAAGAPIAAAGAVTLGAAMLHGAVANR